MDYQVIKHITDQGPDMVLATIVGARGSTPRHEGTNMLVFSDGSFKGTLGGGSGEERMRQAALEALKEKKSQMKTISLNDDMAMKEGMICGGTMQVHLDYLDPEKKDLYKQAAAMIRGQLAGILQRDLKDGRLWILDEQGKPLEGSEGGGQQTLDTEAASRLIKREHFLKKGDQTFEALLPFERMVVCGAGHISIPISDMASRLDFEVTVIDDRADFANKARFPWADQVLAQPFDKALEGLSIDESTYLVLVSRGHTYDSLCLQTILRGPWKYIGMIGSRTRVKKLLDNLEAEGFDRALLDRIHTPIGLDIGAETPHEIAISILAEIISVRRGKRA